MKFCGNSIEVCNYYEKFSRQCLLKQTKVGKIYKGYMWEYEK